MQDTTSYYTVDYKNMFISALVTFLLQSQRYLCNLSKKKKTENLGIQYDHF